MEEKCKTNGMMSKRVRFSHPLEIWKEFDKDNDFVEWNLQQIKDDRIRRKNINDKVEVNGNDKRRNKGKPVRTLTETVQAFQLEDEKTSVRKFIAHYKRTSVNIPSSRVIQRKVHNTIISEFEKMPSNAIDNKTEGNGDVCERCTSKQTGFYCEQHQQQTLVTSSNLQMQDVKDFAALKPPCERTSKLPTLYNGKKLFDERLLPHTEHHRNCTLRDVSYLQSNYRGTSSVQRTPFIVQLFE